MNRRILGIIGAVVLALFGTLALVAYVQVAKNNAAGSSASVDVWVVEQKIEQGTSGSDVEGAVAKTKVPAKLRAEGSVADLADIADLVATSDLFPGEQLVSGRFVTAAAARRGDLPAGLHQVTVELTPERAMGGRIRAGDTVGVFISFDPFDLEGTIRTTSGTVEQLKGKTGNTTHLSLHKLIVAAVQISPNASGVPVVTGDDADAGGAGDKPATLAAVGSAPTESLLVTLAMDARSAEEFVFAAEHGTIWLSAEPLDASEAGTRIVDRMNAYGAL